MMPVAPPPQPKKFPTWVLVVPIACVVGLVVVFLAIWQFLAPAEHHVPVAFSEFMSEVRAGHVDEIRVHDRDITFRMKGLSPGGHAVMRETVGPLPDQAFLNTLHPDDPLMQAPKVIFEK